MKHSNNMLTMEKRNIAISLDKARDWYNRGGEYKELALSAFSDEEIKASMLPNTWEEFCEMYPTKINEWHINDDSNIKSLKKVGEQHLAQIKLHQLRDCYRQGWVPDWKYENQNKWVIFYVYNKYIIESFAFSSRFLSFQSKEIAEKFLNNFQELIKLAGDWV